MEMVDFEFIEKRKDPFVTFIPELCIKAGITDNNKAKIPTLAELISAQLTDADFRPALVSVGNRVLVSTSIATEHFSESLL